ncbi:hypothetical protein GGU10DRAFT_343784 [Lentinula aff. detonsa]|uniref:EthD domain-containing protein n=1 Tax=Lentinula aff. detonsa TaxID=2804958 RepID=A0AA38NQL5_9AGAR|nr:hypothetical protein GGU10DRAFT_343784 [Lentinula aff. detonsa]
MTTTIFSNEADYILSIQCKESLPLSSAKQSPICTYVSQTEVGIVPTLISFFQLHNLHDQPSESASSTLSKLGIQPENDTTYTDVRLYRALGHTYLKDSGHLTTNPSFIVSVALSPLPTPEAEADFNAWYEEEHINLLSQVPGWQACRRFSLVDAIKSTVDSASPPRYLALHAYQDLDGFATPQFRTATNTPWRTRVMQGIVATERNVYRLAERLSETTRTYVGGKLYATQFVSNSV